MNPVRENSAVLQRIATSTLHEFSFVLDRVFIFFYETLLWEQFEPLNINQARKFSTCKWHDSRSATWHNSSKWRIHGGFQSHGGYPNSWMVYNF